MLQEKIPFSEKAPKILDCYFREKIQSEKKKNDSFIDSAIYVTYRLCYVIQQKTIKYFYETIRK